MPYAIFHMKYGIWHILYGKSHTEMMEKSGVDDLIRTIRAQGVIDPPGLDDFRAVRRADFVPSDLAAFAYEDRPLPIAHFQVTTQPSLIAKMLEALELDPADHAMEIGAGLGFQAAILSRLCDQVVTVERFPDLAEVARENLSRAGITNVKIGRASCRERCQREEG